MTGLEEVKWLILLPKDHKHNRHQRGKTNYDNCGYDDDDDDDDNVDDDYDDDNITMMIILCFLHPKGPQTGLAPGGANKL